MCVKRSPIVEECKSCPQNIDTFEHINMLASSLTGTLVVGDDPLMSVGLDSLMLTEFTG